VTVHRGRVSAVDTAGVFVRVAALGPDVVGPLEWLGTKPGVDEGVLVLNAGSESAPDLVVVGELTATGNSAHPATSTDNTVARYDGTGGALQGSGVTIDDSGAIRSESSSGEFRFGSATGSLDFFLSCYASGNNAAVFFRTGATKRWFVGKEATAESGSNAGSNFRIWRYNDDGSSIGEAFGIRRDTGKVTIGAVGATAGLEFGASGPRDMAGSGSPEGVVTAPIGSTWRRTNGGASTTLYVKESGSGNTGWRAV